MKITIEYWWKDIDSGNPKYSEKTVPQRHFFPPQISHGLTSNEEGTPRRALHAFYQHGNNPNPSLRIHLLTRVNGECVGLPGSCKAVRQQQHLTRVTLK